MKIYGYPKNEELVEPLALSEVSLLGDEESLREVARFINWCADEIGSHSREKELDLQFHLQDYSKANLLDGDIVVVSVSK